MKLPTPTPEQPYPRPAYGWYVVGVLLAANLSCYVARMVMILLIQPVSHDLGLSDTRVSLLQGAAFSIFFVTFGLPFGWLVDRRGRRNVLLIGVTVWSVMVLVCGLANTFTQLFLARIGVGVGEAALIPAALSLIGDYIPPHQRGRAVATFYAGALIGTGIATTGGGMILRVLTGGVHWPVVGSLAPWQAVFCLAAVPGLLVVALLLTVREPPRHGVTTASTAVVGVSILPHLRSKWRTYLPVYLTLTLNQFCAYAVTGWVIPLLVRHVHMTTANSGGIYGLAIVGIGFIAAAYVGHVGDRLAQSGRLGGRMRLIIHSYVLFIPAVFLLTLGSTPIVAVGGLLLEVFAVCISAAAMYTLIQDITPNRLRGQAVAILAILVTLVGATLGPTVVALITDYVLHDPLAVGHSILFTAIPGIIVGLAAAVMGLRNYSDACNEITRPVVNEVDPPLSPVSHHGTG
jgi:MFS family permease